MISRAKMAEILRLLHHRNVFLITLLMIAKRSNASLNNKAPCAFLDSTNITDGVENKDKRSIQFENITYAKEFYAIYDNEWLNETYSRPVPQHTRGCTCTIDSSKPCVRMCHTKNENVSDISVNVTSDGQKFDEKKLFEIFNYVVGIPCYYPTLMDPAAFPQTDTWMLFRNGNVLLGDPPTEFLSKDHYCLTPIRNNDTIVIGLIKCLEIFPVAEETWFEYGMITSVPFLVATIIYYIIRPKLRHLYGKSLMCYLSGLIVGYTALGLVKINGSDHMERKWCQTVGYVTYFGFMSAFFWLNVISFELWSSFRKYHIKKQKDAATKQFVVYSIYAWGSPIIMVALCALMDSIPNIPTDFRPGMTGIERCFLGSFAVYFDLSSMASSRWSELYLYLPMILITICNSTLFALTSRKIRKMQADVARHTNNEESKVHRKKLGDEKANWTLFLRLFVVMGVTWSMECASWLMSAHDTFAYVADAINAIQGVIIFFLFVVRGKANAFITERWHLWRGKLSPKNNRTSHDEHTSMYDIDLS